MVTKLKPTLKLPEHTGIALMHLGYSLDNCVEVTDVKKYGDYNQYLANVQKLLEQIKGVDKSRVWYFIERVHSCDNTTCVRVHSCDNTTWVNGNLTIDFPEDGFFVYTNNSGGNVVGARFGDKKYTRGEFYAYLAEQGIKNLFVGGEWAYYNGCIGCLGEMVRIFSLKRISTSPIAGCVYPLNPPQKMNKLLERLYSSAVVLNHQ